MAFRIDLADPRIERFIDFFGVRDELGAFAQTGPGAEAEKTVEHRLSQAESVGQALDFGAEAFRRMTGAMAGDTPEDWARTGLKELRDSYARLSPDAKPAAAPFRTPLKDTTLALMLRGFDARGGAVKAAYQRMLAAASRHLAEGHGLETTRPALERSLGFLTAAGLFDPGDPAPKQAIEDAVVAGQARALIKRDPAAAMTFLQDSAASPETRAQLAGEAAEAARRQTQARRAAFDAEQRRQQAEMAGAGRLRPPLSREDYHDYYGAAEGERRFQVYQGQRARAPLRQAIRGKTPEEIAALRAGAENPELFDALAAEDTAQRRADPAAYALAYDPALAGLPPEQAEAEAWAAQARLGIPAAERRPWTSARQDALARQWLALPAEARTGWLQQTLGALPEEQRAAALSQLAAAGLDQGSPGLLLATWQALGSYNRGKAEAYARKIDSAPPWADETGPAQPRLVQVANSGQIRSDGTGEIWIDVPSKTTVPIAEREAAHETGWRARGLPDVDSPEGWTAPVYTPERQAAIEETLATVLDLRGHPEMLADVEADIQVLFADDPPNRDRILAMARRLATPVTSADRYPGEWEYGSAERTVGEMLDLVGEGKSYDAGWAYGQEDLAKLEEETGYLVRPVAEGMVGFYVDKGSEAFYVMPSTVAMKMANDPNAIEDLALLEYVALGLTDAEAQELANNLDRSEVRWALGKSVFVDRTLADGVLAAHEALKARPEQAQEILSNLYLIVKADRGEEFDYLGAVIEGLLMFSDVAALVGDGKKLVEAVSKGDWDAAKEAGLDALIDGSGLIPGRRIAKALLGPLAKAVGLFKKPAEIALEALRGMRGSSAKLAPAHGPSKVPLPEKKFGRTKSSDNLLMMDGSGNIIPSENLVEFEKKMERKLESQSTISRRDLGLNLKFLMGADVWRDFPKKGELAGWVGNKIGALAENVYRDAARRKMKRDGFNMLEGETRIQYGIYSFNIDYVGIKVGAKSTNSIGIDTVLVRGQRYRLRDVVMMDSKFGTARLSDPQTLGLAAISKNNPKYGGVKIWSPILSDLDSNDIMNILNSSDILRENGIIIDIKRVEELRRRVEGLGARRVAKITASTAVGMMLAMIVFDDDLPFDERE